MFVFKSFSIHWLWWITRYEGTYKHNVHTNTELVQSISLKEKVLKLKVSLGKTEMTLIFVKTTIHFLQYTIHRGCNFFCIFNKIIWGSANIRMTPLMGNNAALQCHVAMPPILHISSKCYINISYTTFLESKCTMRHCNLSHSLITTSYTINPLVS